MKQYLALNRQALIDQARVGIDSSALLMNSRLDRLMAWLLFGEWLAAIAMALWLTPRTWQGPVSTLHPHLLATLLCGPLLVCLAAAAAFLYPGQAFTRHAIATSQMLMSVVLVDATGGAIETHFHIFGSLAFLAFYRDWKVLLTASLVTSADHLLGGLWWPETLYGAIYVEPWRWLIHTAWVGFEDVFLVVLIQQLQSETWKLAVKEAELSIRARCDALTGLPSRQLLCEGFDRLFAAAETTSGCLALLYIDLDRFKQVNDSLGHAVGDAVLSQLAVRLRQMIRGCDILARVGGDEFAMLMPAADKTEAEFFCERLLECFAVPLQVEGISLMLSASIGVALAPLHGTKLEELSTASDAAMYDAKSHGRNQYAVYIESMGRSAAKVRRIAHDLHGAIGRNELAAFFQPQISRDGDLIGFEALLRWNHPSLGMVPPSLFVQVAEAGGLISSLGAWILTQSCRACREWQKTTGLELRVSVNISALQLEDGCLPNAVESALCDSGLLPAFLTLELTESAMLNPNGESAATLRRLRSFGLNFVLDDFGTGYSSLHCLNELPASGIKLCHTFVQRAAAADSSMLAALIDLAHSRGWLLPVKGLKRRSRNNSC